MRRETVIFNICNRCNVRCRHCSNSDILDSKEEMDSTMLLECLNECAKADIYQVTLVGGEPFLYPEKLKAYLSSAKELGLKTCIITNGYWGKNRSKAQELLLGLFQDKKIVLITNGSLEIDYDRLTKYNNIDAISFSTDGSTEEDMKRVSSNYRFDILLQNLERAKQYHVNVAINCTLVQDNIEKLDGLKELAIQYQVKRFKIGFPLGKSKWLKEMVEPIQEKLAHLKSGLEEAGIEFEGPLEVKCIFNGAPIAVISKNGNVYPCCDYFCGRPLVGNVFHDHFDTMWEKDSYERFRSGTYCKGCSQYHRNKTIVNLFGKQVNEADET